MSVNRKEDTLLQMSGDLHKEIEILQKQIETRGNLIDNMHVQIKNNERILEILYAYALEQGEIVKNAKRDESGNVYFDTPEEEKAYTEAYNFIHLDLLALANNSDDEAKK